MSNISGRFKAKFLYPETSQEGQSPFLRMVFALEKEWVQSTESWEDLSGIPNNFASYTYWLSKDKKEGKKCSPYEYSTERFKKDWGFEMGEHPTLEEMKNVLEGVEKILILEDDSGSEYASDFHKVKWINNVGGSRKPREGMVDLSSIL